MPGWKNREAGRRGRMKNVPNEERYFDDGSERVGRGERVRQRELPEHRAEHLTRTATSLGNRRTMTAGRAGEEHELEAVASELDRLLSARSAEEAPHRRPRPPEQRRRSSRDTAADNGRLDKVLGALGKLDRKVENLIARPYGDDDFDEYLDEHQDLREREEPRGRRGVEQYRDNSGHDDDYSADDYDTYDDEFEADGRGPDAYDDYDGEDDYEVESYAHAEPVGRAPTAARSRRAPNDPGLGVYKDLGRRIDSLRKPQVEAFNMVREEIGSLRDAIGGQSSVTQERAGKQNAELRRLANMVERLRVERKDDRFAKDIRKEISELKSLVGRTNVDGTLKTLEHGYAHILQRLDELSRATIDPKVLRGVTARLNEIEDAFASLPRGDHMLVLEDRIAEIAERMEKLLHRNSQAEIEPLRSELRDVRNFVEQIDVGGLVERIDDRMQFVSGRLDDLEILAREQRGLDTRMAAVEERLPDTAMLNRLQGRLEDIAGMMSDERSVPADPAQFGSMGTKLEEIVDRLDRMEQIQPAPADTGAFAALEERLSAISGKIDSIGLKSIHLASAGGSVEAGSADMTALGELQSRIADLSKQLDKPRDTVTTSDLDALRVEIGEMRNFVSAPASTEALEQRISDLAEAVGRGSGHLGEPRLEDLGSKVAALAEQLETSSHRDEDMARVTTALARIEDGLKANRDDVVSIARDAAKEAIFAHPAGRAPEYDQAIEGLQADLRRLLDAAEGTEERTLNTFTGVQSVLGSLTDRLERIEKMGLPRDEANDLASRSGLSGFRSKGRDMGRSRSPKPGHEERPAERARDRKADFIAAARRAAQAASEEAAMMETSARTSVSDGEDEGNKSSARAGWLRNVLKRNAEKKAEPEANQESAETLIDDAKEAIASPVLPGDRLTPEEPESTGGGRRRALLFAAAAVVLTIGALQVFKFVSASGDADTVPVKVATSTQEPEAPVSRNAETTAKVALQNPVPADGQGKVAPPVGTAQSLAAQEPKAEQEPKATTPSPAHNAEAVPTAEPMAAPQQNSDASQALAFAAPSGVNSSFSAEVPKVANEIAQPAPQARPVSLVADLPPEAIGPMALRSAAASGNAAAEFLVGVKYTEGGTVAADLTEAAKWYEKAAEKGLAPAQYRLASLYEKGRGVERNLDKALELYTEAAEAGNAKAMHNLAVLYAEGAGGAPDFTKAAKWFEDAANFGVEDSLFNLGILYARGLGVEKNMVASYKWFAIAADQGDRDAAKKRDDVANTMDQKTLAEARLAVETFKLKTPLAGANKVVTDPKWVSAQNLSTNASAKIGTVVDYQGMVQSAQEKLNKLGFETGTPDGEIGPRTRSAIRAFQRSLGKPETGDVDADLIEQLDSQAI
ncbi:peptidoglycan-binding protein [Roseibium algae]|uniref:Peptidoglycan-binding protein n=1 Tax=Roseibium algae TaxID=3123038 RepID=A0ABU8TGQ0_9HYPH